MAEEGHETLTEEAKNDQEMTLKLMQATQKQLEIRREEEAKEE